MYTDLSIIIFIIFQCYEVWSLKHSRFINTTKINTYKNFSDYYKHGIQQNSHLDSDNNSSLNLNSYKNNFISNPVDHIQSTNQYLDSFPLKLKTMSYRNNTQRNKKIVLLLTEDTQNDHLNFNHNNSNGFEKLSLTSLLDTNDRSEDDIYYDFIEISDTPIYVKSSWSQCNATCGRGIKTRMVTCMIFFDQNQTVQELPDSECGDPKPNFSEGCFIKCQPKEEFTWIGQEDSFCSVTCGKGLRRVVLACKKKSDGSIVDDRSCKKISKPVVEYRECELKKCPPKWNLFPFGPCSQDCGGGQQLREVKCVHENYDFISNNYQFRKNINPNFNKVIHFNNAIKQTKEKNKLNYMNMKAKTTLIYNFNEKTITMNENFNQFQENHNLFQDNYNLFQDNYNLLKDNYNSSSNVISNDLEKKISNNSLQLKNQKKTFVERSFRHFENISIPGESWTILTDDECSNHEKPSKSRLCNMIPCPPSWIIGGWSQCPVSCGEGSQTREIKCEQKLSLANIVLLNDKLCKKLNKKPITSKRCIEIPCALPTVKHQRNSLIQLDEWPYNDYTQLKTTDKLSLNVGGIANVISGTTIIVHCRIVKNLDANLISWSFKNRTINKIGRIKVIKPSVIRIRNSRKSDSGLYDCSIENEKATLNLKVLTPQEADFVALQETRQSDKYKNGYSHAGYPLVVQDDNKIQYDDLEIKQQKVPITLKYLMHIMKEEEIPFQFVTSPWSHCSQTCGSNGIQTRDIQCKVLTAKFSLVVDDKYCYERGYDKAIESRDCGFESCPVWKHGSWSLCSGSECGSIWMGISRRSVECLAKNQSIISNHYCSIESKPIDQQLCYQEACKPFWMSTVWTKCLGECGKKGYKKRKVKCAYGVNKITSDKNCNKIVRPILMKSCFVYNCFGQSACKDKLNYCSRVQSLKLCKYRQYKRECCQSCRMIFPNRFYKYPLLNFK